jgi:CelD/BcsL family acetyltransferase involved in cellulose biosynthesis
MTSGIEPPPDALPLSKVTLETVTTVDGLADLRPDYERLQRITGNTLPFALHEWHLTWCQHFLDCSPLIRDEPLIYILRNAERECVAILPFMTSRRRIGPLKIVSVSLLGADPGISEIRTPLVERGYEHLAVRAVRDSLQKLRDWDWIHWAGASDVLAKALSGVTPLDWQPPLSDFILDLPPTWPQFRSRLKRNIRESLRHCYNSLERDGHRFELQVIKDPHEVRQGVTLFLSLHAMRASLTHTVVHPDRFANHICRDFLYAVCDRLAQRDAVRLFALKIGAETVAMRLGFQVGDSLYLYYSGYDPRWARYSVMTTTVAEAIKYSIGQGVKTVNLSTIAEISKTRWGPRQVDYRSAYEPRGRLRSRLASSAYLRARSDSGYPSKLLQRLISVRHDWK